MRALIATFAVLQLSATLSAGIPGQSRVVATGPYISRSASDSALLAFARHEPDSLRSAITSARVDASAAGSDSGRTAALTLAARLASSYAVAWSDSFFVSEVVTFASAE